MSGARWPPRAALPPRDSTLGGRRGSPPDNVDLVELRPVLARDVDLALGRVVRDAVQHVVAAARGVRVDLREVDPPEHAPVGGRDSCDPIVVPDVRPDLAFDELELVELLDRLIAVAHR